MTIFGKRLSEYVRFQKVVLGLILFVGLARLVLSLAGVPNSTVKWLSITALLLIGLVYYSIRVHTSGFGSYKQLLPLLVIQSVLAQSIAVLAIAIAIFTGRDNIFSAPEYSGGGDGKTWFHVGGHILGMIILPLLGWLVGSAIMFVTKKVLPGDKGRLSPKDKGRAAPAGA
jgi:hypothetical protein